MKSDAEMRGPRPRVLRLALALVIVLASTVVALVAGEALLRWIGYADLAITDPLFRSSDLPGVVYEFRPGARGTVWSRTPTNINALGLRGPEVQLTKPPATWRVGTFGDSYTFGLGVEERQTYSRVLEALLKSCVSGSISRVEVLNFGVPAYNISNIVSTFAEKGLKLGLDVAVLAPIYSDFSFARGLNRARTATQTIRSKRYIFVRRL